MKKLVGLFAGLALLTGLPIAYSANLTSQQTLSPATVASPACAEGSQMIPCLNSLMAQINAQVTPNNMGPLTNWRNVLDNGAIVIQQRGTAAATCGTTSGPGVTAYSADRWTCDVNVGSGAGTLAITTSTPTPPPGFGSQLALVKNSGSLAQPVCLEQELRTSDVISLQGQQVTLSAYIAALAGLAADGGNNAQLVIITGTGTDQGLGASAVYTSAPGMTASPALTPAWTGIATAVNTSVAITTAYGRYSTTAFIPANAKEIGVLVCFTPSTQAGGSTDGIAVTGIQLEQGATAGAFEFKPYAQELSQAQAYYVQWADNKATTFTLPGTCTETTSGTTAACELMLPRTMTATPVSAVATAASFGMTKVADGTAESCTTLAVVASSNNPNSIKLTCAASETAAVGTMHIMLYANSGAANTLTVSTDY